MNPTRLRILAPVAAATVAVGLLAGCTPTSAPVTHPVVAPVTKDLGSLLKATVKVPLNSVLNINTGKEPVNSLKATIADPSIVKFTQGYKTSTAVFNPGFTPLKVGKTRVELDPKDGSYEGVTFTIIVTKG